MPDLQVLRPNVTRDEAIQLFSRGWAARLRRATLGPLQLLADVYIPFHLFRIDIANGRRRETRVLGIDAINGSLDPYEFSQGLNSAKLCSVETKNFLVPRLTEDQAGQICVENVRRILFSRGFFRMQSPRITTIPACETLWIPYWAGFYGANSRASLSVVDAIRRTFEGAKVRELLQDWLQEGIQAAAANQAPTIFESSHSPRPEQIPTQ